MRPSAQTPSRFGVLNPSQEHVLESSGFPGLQAGPGGTTADEYQAYLVNATPRLLELLNQTVCVRLVLL